MTGIRDHVVLLVGGVGGAKLAYGLANILPPEALTVIVNTGDDFEHLGLHISPDLDTVMYTLAGLANQTFGWGLEGDSFQAVDMLAQYGGPAWFKLGDRDMATHLLRTESLRAGEPLSVVMDRLRRALGVEHVLLPMSDAPVRTILETDEGLLNFQDYFVRRHWAPVVHKVHYQGAEWAEPAPGVLHALEQASLIVFGPSNPYLSLGPVLAVPAIAEAVRGRSAFCAAVSPIIDGQAVKGPAAKLMRELGVEPSPLAIAAYFQGFIDGLILDTKDAHLLKGQENISLDGSQIQIKTLPTLMNTTAEKTALASEILSWAIKKFRQ